MVESSGRRFHEFGRVEQLDQVMSRNQSRRPRLMREQEYV
jgi:hypothetical protein